jgi:DNA-binding response OmpR family regulator
MNILFVEDDAKIAKFVAQGLKEEGHAVRHLANGAEAFEAARDGGFDLLLLDVMLPGKDGVSLCRDLRSLGNQTPVIMLTARDSVESRVNGLDAGADDYMVKPFAFAELVARVRAMDRRRGERQEGGRLTVDGLTLDLAGHKVSYKGKQIELTAREFTLLHLFLKRRGHVLSRTVILESVWGYDFQTGTNIVEVYVNYLRQKLKSAAGRPLIRTVRGRGYVFEGESEDGRDGE